VTRRYDLAVIGGGSAGLTTAAIAGRVGARTILIDRERLGGDCTHYGCVPSKSLIRCAKVAHTARHADRYGVRTPQVEVDYGRVAAYVREAIATIASHETPEIVAQQGVEVAFGGARFLSPTRIRVGEREIEATSSVLAVGSGAHTPPLPGLDKSGAIDHVDLFELTALPPRIAVLGAGPIGMELGQALARLGAEVTILQRGGRILKRDDAELTDLLAGYVRDELRLVCNATVRQARVAHGVKELVFETDGKEATLVCDEILVAVGRKPSLEGLGLEAAGVAFTERGVIVDAKLRTTARNIWACGDCTGSMQFTHFAEAQARVAARNALFVGSQSFEPEPTPWVTFTDPELAHVGMTEAEARATHPRVEVFRYPYAKLDRAVCEGETHGLAKIVTVPSGRILGASILGPHAGEAITEVVIAMKSGITLQRLSGFVHPYPVMNRIIRRLGDERFLAHGVGTVTRKLFGRYRGNKLSTDDR
jgi:pyruvate/2-oxoglutarate dehydrogenase complex dihydrolipoamide dehydrogenase (E3) component